MEEGVTAKGDALPTLRAIRGSFMLGIDPSHGQIPTDNPEHIWGKRSPVIGKIYQLQHVA